MSVRRTAALALVAALVLAGCQEEPEPRFEPTPSDSSPPTDPETDEPAAQTAEEFIQEWVDLQREMQNSGETEAFLAASEECHACIELAELVAGYYEAGGYVETRGWTLTTLIRHSETGPTLEFEARIKSAPTVYLEQSGGTVERLPAGKGRERFVVRRSDRGWQMVEIAEIAQ
jgi:hypothetical protein